MPKPHVPAGRPRSEQARTAVLHAVDDLLVEVGYAALTMRGIAERAGVSRQTVHRWWTTKAEVLFEAALTDAAKELIKPPRESTIADIAEYLDSVDQFLTVSPAGLAYRALLGEAQHDPQVARLVQSTGLFDQATHALLTRAIARGDLRPDTPFADATAILTGPAVFRLLTDVKEATSYAMSDPRSPFWPAALLAAITRLAPDQTEPAPS